MHDPQTEEFTTLVDSMARAGAIPGSEELTRIAHALAKLFHVDADEVAILHLNPKGTTLKFLIPEKLAVVGSLPTTSTGALAPRTVRERRPEMLNNFGASKHATVFEGVSLGRQQGETIHKIISAPVLDGVKVTGVVQISRKGQSPADAGPDFTSKDLRLLTSLSPVIDRLLKLCVPASAPGKPA